MGESVTKPPPKDRFDKFWGDFHLFPFPWGNALVQRPAWLWMVFLVTYGAYFISLLVDAHPGIPLREWGNPEWSAWWGNVFIFQAETHLLFIAGFAVSLFMVSWGRHIPDLFQWLRQPVQRLSHPEGGFEERYYASLVDYQGRLASRIASFLVSLYMIVLLTLFLVFLIYTAKDNLDFVFRQWWGLTLTIYALVWAYLIGLFIWPVIVTVRFLQALTREYALLIQPSHPDHCGGLKPVGDFCFSMSLPVIIGAFASVLVGIGGVLFHFSGMGEELYRAFVPGSYFSPLVAYASLLILLLIVTPLLIVTFFLPLKFVHEAMLSRKRAEEDAFAAKVSELEERIPELASRVTSLEAARRELDQLEILRTAFPPRGYPSWPFRPTLTLALFSPQILGLVGLLLTFWQILKE